MASTPSSPAYFDVLLERRWAEGITKVRHLFEEIRRRGYTGSFSHLARFLAPWRSGAPSLDDDEQEAIAPVRVRTLDPMTGRAISPLTAAALCVKPRSQMTARQAASVDALNAGSAELTTMRRLAMQFRGLLRSRTAERLDAWLTDARALTVRVKGNLITSDMELRRHAVIAGLGVALAAPFNIHEELRTGSLMPMLRNYPTQVFSIAAVYSHRRHLAAKVRVFIDALARLFAGCEWLSSEGAAPPR